ncbi:DUF1642 domain-containing protein [Streptococcus dysgalactiae]|uniref:DUF1642 domain-containing protein n=1 Tax=Streptococcus dysgalactiae TaxID=1334 RepID=UPI000E08987B|nr:DUF1642 domain-containing protein [Streptococcus dysgalactiae]QQC49341.1 DUF1642 domain-containing protein [Streptococcus dysgalactiae]SUN65797.1 phage protein [Streptococcus dysgalactiae subsp. equisimilis]
MNIEEAKEKIKEISYGTGIFLTNYEVNSKKVLEILDQLDQPKPEVPQFVADYIDDMHKNARTLRYAFKCMESNIKMHKWCVFERQETFINAFLHGYTIEKEKLYTVEIPNPNSCGGKLVLYKQQSTGNLILDMLNSNINKPKYLWLTEKEIRKDFDWAWQFAEEVKG